MKLEKKINRITLLGTTISGEKFRPSDWAQRLTVAVSTVGPKKKIISHPYVHMAIINGLPAVVIDSVLEQENNMMFDYLINFGKSNNLQIEYPWAEEVQSQEVVLEASSKKKLEIS